MDKRFECWLIELFGQGRPLWLAAQDGLLYWTEDANQALKYADKRSAEQTIQAHDVATGENALDIRATDHCWPDGLGDV